MIPNEGYARVGLRWLWYKYPTWKWWMRWKRASVLSTIGCFDDNHPDVEDCPCNPGWGFLRFLGYKRIAVRPFGIVWREPMHGLLVINFHVWGR